MNKLEFYRYFGYIDEDLITAADIKPETKKHTLKNILLAASLTAVLLLTITLTLKSNSPIIISPSSVTTQATKTTEATTLLYNEASNISASLTRIPGHFWQELTESEKTAVFGELAKKYSISATANFSKTEEVKLINIKAIFRINESLCINVTVAPEEIADCCVFTSDKPDTTEVNGVNVTAGIYEYLNEPEQTFFARFRIADTFYLVKMTGTKENERAFSELIGTLTLSTLPVFSAVTPIVPELKDESLALSEAYADEEFGSFVPKSIPSLFTFESSHRFINQEYNYLSVLWCNGLNDIGFQISYITDYDRKNITSVEDTKNYDLSLYPIPRAETVPEELWEIVDSPVFIAEELTAEVIEKRVTNHNENGETTKIINFSILTENDIIISVSTSGIEPQELYGIIADILKANS